MGGLSVISNLKLIVVSSKVLILTSGDSRNFAILALQADADGFVCKDDNLDELIGAVKRYYRVITIFRPIRFIYCAITQRLPPMKVYS